MSWNGSLGVGIVVVENFTHRIGICDQGKKKWFYTAICSSCSYCLKYHKHTNHIEVSCHFIRKKEKQGNMLGDAQTKEQVADFLLPFRKKKKVADFLTKRVSNKELFDFFLQAMPSGYLCTSLTRHLENPYQNKSAI